MNFSLDYSFRFEIEIKHCVVVMVTGSPFQFTVGPITEGGAHKVRAAGPGLERGEVDQPSKYRWDSV